LRRVVSLEQLSASSLVVARLVQRTAPLSSKGRRGGMDKIWWAHSSPSPPPHPDQRTGRRAEVAPSNVPSGPTHEVGTTIAGTNRGMKKMERERRQGPATARDRQPGTTDHDPHRDSRVWAPRPGPGPRAVPGAALELVEVGLPHHRHRPGQAPHRRRPLRRDTTGCAGSGGSRSGCVGARGNSLPTGKGGEIVGGRGSRGSGRPPGD